MAPRDVSNCVGHCKQGEHDGERNIELDDAELGKGRGFFFFQAEDGIRAFHVTEFRRVLFRSGKEGAFGCSHPPSDSDGGSDAAPPNACKPTENAMGVGAPCTKGGNECKTGLSCSADQAQSSGTGPGFCLKIGRCTTNADCGGGDATCCAPAEGGGAIKICIPESCRPSTCAV